MMIIHYNKMQHLIIESRIRSKKYTHKLSLVLRLKRKTHSRVLQKEIASYEPIFLVFFSSMRSETVTNRTHIYTHRSELPGLTLEITHSLESCMTGSVRHAYTISINLKKKIYDRERTGKKMHIFFLNIVRIYLKCCSYY